MTSSVTNSFHQVMLSRLQQEIDSSSPDYYVGLARGEVFTETEDFSSLYLQRQGRHALQSVKILANSSLVVASESWTENRIYNAWNDKAVDNYYVVNSKNEVFVCVETATTPDGVKLPSTVEPVVSDNVSSDTLDGFLDTTGTGRLARTFRLSGDGYKWRYLYKLSNLAISSYKTTDWLPVKTITATTDGSIPQENQQRLLQDSAVAGEIIGIEIVNGGSSYASAPTIAITGNGTSAAFTAVVSGGSVTRIQVDSDAAGNMLHGSGYSYATAVPSVGNAQLRPIIAPKSGLNADPVSTLKTKSLMLQDDFAGDEFDTILAENDFNQILLLRDLKTLAGARFSANTGSALKSLDVSITAGSQFVEDELFSNGGETATGKVMFHDTTANKLYYWQDETTGFTAFDNTLDNTITAPQSATSATFSAENAPDFDAYSGDILYLNSVGGEGVGEITTGIDRQADQTEDVRIVLQLTQCD